MARQNLPELWGGIECTVVRLGDGFRDQAAETGHRERLNDLDAIAALGIRRLRYPFVWETVAPEHPDRCDFSWHDERLARLRGLGVKPIADLAFDGSLGRPYLEGDQPSPTGVIGWPA